MEYILILALAVFLMSSASHRDTVLAPKRVEPSSRSQRQTVPPSSYTAVPLADNVQTSTVGGYEQSDAAHIRDFIRKFQKKAPEYQIDTMANAVIRYGKVYDVDPKLMAALIARESGFDPKAASATGAMGLGQIKSFHYARLGITDPYDIDQNTKGTAMLMRELLNKWSAHSRPVDMALAEYTEGMTALADKTYGAKTQKYIDDIYTYKKQME